MLPVKKRSVSIIAAALALCTALFCGCANKAPGGEKQSGTTSNSLNSKSNFVASRTEDYEVDTAAPAASESLSSQVSSSEKKTSTESEILDSSPVQSSLSPIKVTSTQKSTVTAASTVSTVTEAQTSGGTATESVTSTTGQEEKRPMELSEKVDYSTVLMEGVPDRLKTVCGKISQAMEDRSDQVRFQYGEADQEELQECLLLVSFTNPDVTGVSAKYVVSVDPDGFVTRLKLEYTNTLAESEENSRRLRETLDEIVSGCTASDEFELVEYIHDEIIKRCSYDPSSENMLNAYGCLVDGKAVCEGYAKAFMLVCSEMGIECLPVIGTTISADGTEEPHMWDIAKVDGRWYHFDLTWDDPITDIGEDFVKYDYFGLSDDGIAADHSINKIPYLTYPAAVSERGGYFLNKGLYSYSADRAAEMLQQEINSAVAQGERFVRIQVAGKDVFDQLCGKLFEPDESGSKPIFAMLYKAQEETDSQSFDPSRYKKMLSDGKCIITLVLSYAEG